MLQNSRALRRASDVASARAAVTGRRPMTALGIVAGVVLGASVTVGAVSIPAAGLADAGAAAAAPARMTAASAPFASGTPIAPGAMPLTAIADEATQVFDEAKGAVAAAETLNAEVADSGLDVEAGSAELDASTVKDRIGTLEDRELLPALLLPPLTSRVASATSALVADTAVLREAFTAAREKKAAEDAARAEAGRVAAEAAALASANTVDGAKATARELAASRYGWGAEQFSCLDSL